MDQPAKRVVPSLSEDQIVRFWSQVDRSGTQSHPHCWPWVNGKTQGYGVMHVGTRAIKAHRISYTLLVGEIPPHLELDHLCRNRACCNPAHLEPVSHQENMLRGETITRRFRERTQCGQGHPLSGPNLSRRANGSRRCLTCHAASMARARAKRAA